jgi:hypothetical protein
VAAQAIDIDHKPGKTDHPPFQPDRGDFVQLCLAGRAALQQGCVSHWNELSPELWKKTCFTANAHTVIQRPAERYAKMVKKR